MNKPDTGARALILRPLVEKNSMRAVTRIVDVSKNNVTKPLEDAGKACAAYKDEHVWRVQAEHVQTDEIWYFVHAMVRTMPIA